MNEMLPKKIEDPRKVILSDYITVIRGTKAITYIGSELPLNKVRIYKGEPVTVIAETPLHGEIYKYGNHGGFWEQIGTTCGYA